MVEGTDSASSPTSAHAWHLDLPDTAQQALQSKMITLRYTPSKPMGQASSYQPLSSNVARGPYIDLSQAESDMVGRTETANHSTTDISWCDIKPRAAGILEDTIQHAPVSVISQYCNKKRRKVAIKKEDDPSGHSRVAASGWIPPLLKDGSIENPLSIYERSSGPTASNQLANHNTHHEPSTASQGLNHYTHSSSRGYRLSEARALSKYGEAVEVTAFTSSSDSSPQRPRIEKPTSEAQSITPKLRIRFRHAYPYGSLPEPCSAFSYDSQGSPYPSPYTSAEPSINILAYDAAQAKKSAPLQPSTQSGKQDKYTSVLEHDLAITKTRLAKANHLLLQMQRVEMAYEALKRENESQKRRLERLSHKVQDEAGVAELRSSSGQAVADANADADTRPV